MNTEQNQHITKATDTIAVSVIDARFGGRTAEWLAESAIIVNLGTKEERVIGVQHHGRGGGRRRRTNRAIAQQIARQIRKREAAKEQN